MNLSTKSRSPKFTRRKFLKQAALAGAALSVPLIHTRYADASGDINPTAVKTFGASLKGRLIVPSDKEFDSARMLWNARFDRRPAMIAQCGETDDVRRAVEFAQEHRMLASVRSGGHDPAGYSANDGGMVIDLGPMTAIGVDATKKSVSAEPGARVGELYSKIGKYNLAAVCGACPSVGLGGIITGGGEGWLMNKFGTASDNVLAAQLVTADGHLVEADPTSNADLFWAIRGGSGNFGIVTQFTLRAFELEPITRVSLLFPLSRFREVASFIDDFVRTKPDELTIGLISGMPVPSDRLLIAAAYYGNLEHAKRALKPLHSVGDPLAQDFRVVPGTQGLMDQEWSAGLVSFWNAAFVPHLKGAIDALDAAVRAAPSGYAIQAYWIGGAAADGTSAYPLRGGGFDISFQGFCVSGTSARAARSWVSRLKQGLAPHAKGAYVNEVGSPGEAHVVFGANYERLLEIKRKYDPANFFHMNQNITPTL